MAPFRVGLMIVFCCCVLVANTANYNIKYKISLWRLNAKLAPTVKVHRDGVPKCSIEKPSEASQYHDFEKECNAIYNSNGQGEKFSIDVKAGFTLNGYSSIHVKNMMREGSVVSTEVWNGELHAGTLRLHILEVTEVS